MKLMLALIVFAASGCGTVAAPCAVGGAVTDPYSGKVIAAGYEAGVCWADDAQTNARVYEETQLGLNIARMWIGPMPVPAKAIVADEAAPAPPKKEQPKTDELRYTPRRSVDRPPKKTMVAQQVQPRAEDAR